MTNLVLDRSLVSHLAGQLCMAQQRSSLRIAAVSDCYPASSRSLDLLALITTASNVWVSRRTPQLDRPDRYRVSLWKWRNITPIASPVTLGAGMEVSDLHRAADGSAVMQICQSTYYVPGGAEMVGDSMVLELDAPAMQLSLPDISPKMAECLATMLFEAPTDSGPIANGIEIAPTGEIDVPLGGEARFGQDGRQLAGPTVRILYKSSIPRSNEVVLPGLLVGLEPPRGKR